MSDDEEPERILIEDEYWARVQRAVATTKDADFEMLWHAFREWIDEQVEAGPWNQFEVMAAVFRAVGGDAPSWRREQIPSVRARVEDAFFGEFLPKQPRDSQVNVIAEMWRCGEGHDTRSQQLLGAINAMGKRLPRRAVWRALQAIADAYRVGEPLKMKDRVTLLARKHLPEKTWNRIMADAIEENGSTAKSYQRAASQLVSKAEEYRAEPLPDDGPDLGGTRLRLHETYPLVADMVRCLFTRGVLGRRKLKECMRDPKSIWYVENDAEREAVVLEHYDGESMITEIDEQEYPALAEIDHLLDVEDILDVADP